MFHFSKLPQSDVMILKFAWDSFCTRFPQGGCPSDCHHQGDFPSLGLAVLILLITRRWIFQDTYTQRAAKGFYSPFDSYQIIFLIIFRCYLFCQVMPPAASSSELKTQLKYFWDFEPACISVFTLGVLFAAHGGHLNSLWGLSEGYLAKSEEHSDSVEYLPQACHISNHSFSFALCRIPRNKFFTYCLDIFVPIHANIK